MKFRVNAIAIITAAFFALATQVVAAQESIILSFNGYDGYYPYAYNDDYYDDGGCYVVRRRVHTRYGWRWTSRSLRLSKAQRPQMRAAASQLTLNV